MRLGVALPTTGDSASAETITEVAATAERIGLHSLWTFERLLAPTAGGQMDGQTITLPDAYKSVFSPLEVLAFAAAHTSRITLGTSIMVALLHNPADLARRFATLDRLSGGGRVVAGLGQGWMAQEFETAGVPLTNRGPRFSEFIEVMRAAWGPDPVSYDGRFYRVQESSVGPKPVQGSVPILAGAASPGGIRRAARLGLGLNPVWFGWEALEGTVQAYRAAAAEAGHDPATLPVVVRVNQFVAAEPTEDGASPTGSPE